MAGEMIYYYSALWAALEDGTVVTVGGEDHIIGTDAFNDYGEASAAAALVAGTTIQDLDTYYDSTWTDGGTVTVHARGGTYTTIASATKSNTTNAFTTADVAKAAHTSYYPDGGCVIGGTVTTRTLLNGNSQYQLILNGYTATGGADQGVGLGALDTKTTNGLYAVIGQGSNLKNVYVGHRNSGKTTGEIVVKVVDNAQVTNFYLGALYDARVGDPTESLETGFSTNVHFTADGSKGAKITNLYGSGISGLVYAYVTADIVNMSGINISGGGSANADKNYGTFTVNLRNSSAGVISVCTVDKTNDVVGTMTVNVQKGDNSVTKGIVLRSTDCVSVKLGEATLTTAGFYSTYTNASKPTVDGIGTPDFTIDATGFEFAENETQEKFLTTTAKYASVNFTIMEGENISSRYIVVNDASKNYYVVEEHPVAYNSLWYGLAEGTVVTAFGAKYTIGTDAFADASRAVAKAGELSTYVRSVDSFYCPEWAAHTVIIDGETIAVPAKSFGDKVSVDVDGTTMELTIGIDAFTSLAAAQQVAGTRYAAVRYGEKTAYTSGRYAVLSAANQTVVLSHHTDTSSGFNVGLVGGDVNNGVVIFANDSSISQFDTYGSSHTSHFTAIVDHSYVRDFFSGVKASSDVTYENDEAGRVIWTGGKHGTVDHIIRNGGTVSNAYFGTGSEKAEGDVNITLENVTVKNVYGSGTATGGWFRGNATLILKGSSVTTFSGKNAETTGGAHFISIVAEEGNNRIGAFSDNTTYVSGIELLVKEDAALDMASVDLNRSSNVEAAGLLQLKSLAQTGTMELASGGTLSIVTLNNRGTAVIKAGGMLAATGAVTNSDTAVMTAEKGATLSFGTNFTNAGSFTFSVENMLNVTGDLTNTGTITVDATGYAFPAESYSVKVVHAGSYLTGALDIDNHYQLVGAAENCGLYTYYNDIYYGENPAYVANIWRNVGEGKTVYFAGKPLTMGTDAFASADDAKAKGYRNILTAEVYVDAAWSTKSPKEKITVTLEDGSTVDAFYGVNAFSDFDSAVSALANGGAGIDIVGAGVSGTTATVNTPLYLEEGTSLSVATLNLGGQGDFRILENASFSASTSFNNSGTTLVESGATFSPVYLQNTGTLTLENGATYTFSNLGNNGGTLNITVAGGLTVSGALSNSGTINIDAADYVFGENVDAVKVVDAGNDITSLDGYNLIGGESGKELFIYNGDIWYGKSSYAYFSAGWTDKSYGDTVNVIGGGTATFGVNAFTTYNEAWNYNHSIIGFCDTYAIGDGSKVGDTAIIDIPGGSFSVKVDGVTFNTDLGGARSHLGDYSGNAVVWYAGTISGGRTAVTNLVGVKTVIYDLYSIFDNTGSSGPGPIVGINNSAGAGKKGDVTLGKGSRAKVVCIGRAGAFSDIDIKVTVKDDAYVDQLATSFMYSVSTSGGTSTAPSGKYIWDGDHSKATFNIEGGTVTLLTPTLYTGTNFTGDIYVKVSGNGFVEGLSGREVGTINANIFVDMKGGTIASFNGVNGYGARYFEITISGHTTSTIGALSNIGAGANKYSITVKANEHATLAIGGKSTLAYTIDNTDFAFDAGEYGFAALQSNVTGLTYTLVDPDYTDYGVGTFADGLYFYQNPIEVSKAFINAEEGDVVPTFFGSGTIGVNAFATRQAVEAAGVTGFIKCTDIFVDGTLKDGDILTVEGATYTIGGGQAFSSVADAVAKREALGKGTVCIEGGTFSNRYFLNGIPTYIADVYYPFVSGGGLVGGKDANNENVEVVFAGGSVESYWNARGNTLTNAHVVVQEGARVDGLYVAYSGTVIVNALHEVIGGYVGSLAVGDGGVTTAEGGLIEYRISDGAVVGSAVLGSNAAGGAVLFKSSAALTVEDSRLSTISFGAGGNVTTTGSYTIRISGSTVTNGFGMSGLGGADMGAVNSTAMDIEISSSTISKLTLGRMRDTGSFRLVLDDVTVGTDYVSLYSCITADKFGTVDVSLKGMDVAKTLIVFDGSAAGSYTVTGDVAIQVQDVTAGTNFYAVAGVTNAAFGGNMTVDLKDVTTGTSLYILTDANYTLAGDLSVTASGVNTKSFYSYGVVTGDSTLTLSGVNTFDGNISGFKSILTDTGSTLSMGGIIEGVQSITVDAQNCDYTQDRYTIISGVTNLKDLTVTLINDAHPEKGYSLVKDGDTLYYQLPTVYFSKLWEGKSGSVKLGNKDLTIGIDAFESYSAAVDAGKKVIVSGDVYLNSTYNAGTPIEIPSGTATYTATFGTDAFNNAENAVSKAQEMGGALRVTGGTFGTMSLKAVTTFIDDTKAASVYANYRAGLAADKTAKVVVNSSTFTSLTVSSQSGVTGMSNFQGGIEFDVTGLVADNIGIAYRDTGTSLDDNSAIGVKDVVFSVTNSTLQYLGNEYRISASQGSNIAIAATSFVVNLAGSTVSEELGAGRINLAVTGGMASINGAEAIEVTGDVRNIGGSRTVDENGVVTFKGGTTLVGDQVVAGGTVVVTGGATNYKTLNVNGGSSTVGKIFSFEKLNIKVGSTLVAGSISAGTAITVDASGCDYSKLAYLVLTAPGVSAEDIKVEGGDPSKEYSLVQRGNSIFYQTAPVYFSIMWEGKSGTVYLGEKELTIGVDAFASYDLAVAAGKGEIAASGDVYLNSTYSATDPITVDNYTALYGVDAFATVGDAVSAAQKMGGALRVTGGTFSPGVTKNRTTLSVANLEIVNTGIDNTLEGMTSAYTGNIKEVIRNSTIGNYFYAVGDKIGGVTGNIDVTLDNVEVGFVAQGARTFIVSAGTVTGNVNAEFVNGTKFYNDVYVLNDGTTVFGDVTVTVGDGVVVDKKGIVNNGTITGQSNVEITGDATVSAIANFATITIDNGAVLRYGAGERFVFENHKVLTDVVNNGTLCFNTEIAQNSYIQVANRITGSGTITSDVGNGIFVKDDITYAAATQKRMMIDATLTEKSFLDEVTIGGVKYIYGISAFRTKEEATDAQFYKSEASTLVVVGGTETNIIYGKGHIEFNGSTVTKSVYAGQEVSEDTVSNDTSVKIVGIEGKNGSYASLIGAHQVTGAVTQSGNSAVVISGENNVSGKAIVGSSYVTNGTLTFADSTSSVTIESGYFNSIVVGGALANKDQAHINGTLDSEVLISGGTVKAVCGGCYLQGGTSTEGIITAGDISVNGDSSVTIEGGRILSSVFGGNLSKNTQSSTSTSSILTGNTSVTIDASKSIFIGGNIVAGSEGNGVINGNTKLSFTGMGANLTVYGTITGCSSSGLDTGDGRSGVTGTRTLEFTGFNGTLKAGLNAEKKIIGFSDVNVAQSDVTLEGHAQLKNVTNWAITDGTIGWSKATANDFTGDKLSLVYSGELNEAWTVFRLTDDLLTTWDKFALDDSGDNKISLSINGTQGDALWNGGDIYDGAYVATIEGTDYQFYREENNLKVAKVTTVA